MEIRPDRWEVIQRLFHEAAEVPVTERRAFLEAACGDDLSLIADVLALLERDSAPSPLDRGITEVSGEVFDSPDLAGQVIGPYRLFDVIGRGGMGVVYRAERTDLGNPVAIKTLREGWISPGSRARFEREQRTLAHLAHPNIARFLDAATLPDGSPYFVIEYVDGVPITDYCERARAPLATRLALFRAVCEAVQFAHRNAIIHRDIKPSNILVTGEGIVKLLDFGVAKQLDGIAVGAEVTAIGSRVMTPAYAAPEQARGGAVGVYTDVYSLGVLLYELLCGRSPFSAAGRTPGEVEAAVLSETPQKPSVMSKRRDAGAGHLASIGRIGPAAWKDLDVICLTAMQKEPERRYSSVEALARDIENHVSGHPLEARPDSVRYRAGRFLHRNVRAVAASALVAVGILVLSAYYAFRLADENRRVLLEAAKAQQISDYLIGLFEAADPFTDSVALDVNALLDRGERQAGELTDQPVIQAQMLDVLGRVHTNLSNYERATTLLENALRQRRNLDPTSLDVAETLSNLGILHYYTGDYEAAESALREALEVRERHLPGDHPDRAETLDNLGVVLSSRGEIDSAVVLFEEALRVRRMIYTRPHQDLGQTLNNLAVALYNLGDLESAERLYLEALENDRALFGEDHPTLATNLANLARVHQDREEHDRAEQLLVDALRIRRQSLGDDHFETAISHSQIANLYNAMGRLDQAQEHHEEALRIRQELLGMNHSTVGTTINGLALVQFQRGDYAAAEAGFRRAAEIYSVSLGATHRFTGVALCNLAATLHHAGRADEAERAFQDGLAILQAVHEPGHPELAYNRSRFAALLVDLTRFAEAETLLRDAHQSLLDAYGPDHQQTRTAAELLAKTAAAAR